MMKDRREPRVKVRDYSGDGLWRILGLAFVIFLFAICIGTAIGQEQGAPLPMTNSDVLKLVKGGLSDELIVKNIKSRPTHFDLSADAMLDLKKDSVPDD